MRQLQVGTLLLSAYIAFQYHLREHFECQASATDEELQLAGITPRPT